MARKLMQEREWDRKATGITVPLLRERCPRIYAFVTKVLGTLTLDCPVQTARVRMPFLTKTVFPGSRPSRIASRLYGLT